MTTRKQEEEFMDEAPAASDQSSVQGQMSLADLLDVIESRANVATKGPWYQDPTNDIGEWLVGSTAFPVADCDFAELNRRQITGNSAFIAAARSDVPALVKALREAIKWARPVDPRYFEKTLAQLLRESAEEKK